MSNLDMAEAVRLLAADRGIPVDTLLQVLADALVAAYKSRPDAADEAEVEIDADTMDIFTEISRGTDKWLWFVEAHIQGEPPRPGKRR